MLKRGTAAKQKLQQFRLFFAQKQMATFVQKYGKIGLLYDRKIWYSVYGL